MGKPAYTPGDARQEAFMEIEPHRSFLQSVIMAVIRAAGDQGLTCDEVEVQTHLPHQSASARMNELATKGSIYAVGKRKTRSGRFAVSWAVDSKR